MDQTVFVGIVQFIVLLLSLSVHESAHAWSADVLGDPTARHLGRVSLNPIVHADLFGTVIFPIIGLFSGFMFGWAKPVPVNLSRLKNPTRDHMLVAAAGPASNILMAVGLLICLMIIKASSAEAALVVLQVASFAVPEGGGVLVPLTVFAFWGVVLNVILAVFNLIPVAPLDGAAVLSGLLPRSMSSILDSLQPYGMMILILLLVTGVPAMLYFPVLRLFLSFLAL